MPSAGAVCPPVITPIRRHVYGQSTTHIDTSTLIEINCETPDTKIYFTADGTKPNPYQRKVGGKEVVFRYTAPFTLKDGKRTLKAVAVTRDGLKESDVITKTYVVDDIGKINSSPITVSSSDLDNTDFFDSDGVDYTDSTLTSKASKSSKSSKDKKDKKKKSKSPPRTLRSRSKSPIRSSKTKIPKEAWASSPVPDRLSTGAFGDNPTPPIPDGPFNPTNYSGTQINVWGGAPPPYVQGGVPGSVNLGPPGICNPYTTQYGYLTENMIQNCNPETKHVTVGDLRQLLKSRQQPAVAPPPEVQQIEYPTYKDPPLNPISPGGGRTRFRSKMSPAPTVTFASHPKPFT